MDGVKKQGFHQQHFPALGYMALESTWIYAACDEASSSMLAKGGIEVRSTIGQDSSICTFHCSYLISPPLSLSPYHEYHLIYSIL